MVRKYLCISWIVFYFLRDFCCSTKVFLAVLCCVLLVEVGDGFVLASRTDGNNWMERRRPDGVSSTCFFCWADLWRFCYYRAALRFLRRLVESANGSISV